MQPDKPEKPTFKRKPNSAEQIKTRRTSCPEWFKNDKQDKPSSAVTGTKSLSTIKKQLSVPKLLLNSSDGAPNVEKPAEDVNVTRKIKKEESIWDRIIEFQQGHDSIIMPSNDKELRSLLEKIVGRKEFVKFAQTNIKDFDTRYKVKLGDIKVSEILNNFPETLELFNKEGVLGFTDEEVKCFEKLRNTNNEFKGFRKDILELLSSKSKSASDYYFRHIESLRKLLRYYTPANSEYVMKLIGNIRYKDIIANSLYMFTSVARFVLKQYSDELRENARRLEDTYKETERLLRLLVKRKIILSTPEGKFKTTPDSQALVFVIFRVWRDVFKITNAPTTDGQKHDSNIKGIKDIHPVKALEYTLNMFIALSKYMMDLKKIEPSFYYDANFSNDISSEFAVLIANNLKSRSLAGAVYEAMGAASSNSNCNSSVNAKTFKYKLDLIHKLLYESEGAEMGADVLSEDKKYVENDERIKNSIESTVEELTRGRKFVMDESFIKILKIKEDGELEEGVKAKNAELSDVMNLISNTIASEAGIKVNKTELKYLLIGKTLITLLASYILNTMILKKWFSVPLQILINLHGIDYLSSYLQYFINQKEEQAKAEYNKYNEKDKEFNHIIELLFEQELIYPLLKETESIETILCEQNIKKYLAIIAESFTELTDVKIKTGESNIALKDISPQDMAVMAKSMFIELCFYSIEQPEKKAPNVLIKSENIKIIADGFRATIQANLEKNEGSKLYTAKTSPDVFSEKIRLLLLPYMQGLQVAPKQLPSSSNSSMSSSEEVPKPIEKPAEKPVEKPALPTEVQRTISLTQRNRTNPIIELASVVRLEKMDSPKISPSRIPQQSGRPLINSLEVKKESPRSLFLKVVKLSGGNSPLNARKPRDFISSNGNKVQKLVNGDGKEQVITK